MYIKITEDSSLLEENKYLYPDLNLYYTVRIGEEYEVPKDFFNTLKTYYVRIVNYNPTIGFDILIFKIREREKGSKNFYEFINEEDFAEDKSFLEDFVINAYCSLVAKRHLSFEYNPTLLIRYMYFCISLFTVDAFYLKNKDEMILKKASMLNPFQNNKKFYEPDGLTAMGLYFNENNNAFNNEFQEERFIWISYELICKTFKKMSKYRSFTTSIPNEKNIGRISDFS